MEFAEIKTEFDKISHESFLYRQHKAKIEEIEKEIDTLIKTANEIKGTLSLITGNQIKQTRKRKPNTSGKKSGDEIDTIVTELLEKMHAGTLVRMSLIQSTYPELSDNQARNIWNRISKSPNVNRGNEKRDFWLFSRRSN
jgi:hypothetical protein